MDKLSVIGKIGTILSDLQKQQEFFAKNHDSLNEVEVELFAASANYLAEYAKVLKKFPVSRLGAPLVPPRAAAQAVPQEEDDDIGFRLSFEEDDKKIHQPGAADIRKPKVNDEPLAEELAEAAKEPGEEPGQHDDSSNAPAKPGKTESEASRNAVAEAFLNPEPSSGATGAAPSSAAPGGPASAEPASSAGPSASSEPPASAEPSVASPAEKSRQPVGPSRTEQSVEGPGRERPGELHAEKPADSHPREEEAPSRPSQPLFPHTGRASAEEPPASETPSPSPKQPSPGPSPASGASPASAPSAASAEEERRQVSLNERFGEKKSTLYERIAPKQHQQPSQAPIPNLGRSIGINERYYFIKTLFHDDKVAFDQAITRIDMCHSLGEALEYTNKSLAGKYSWSRKEEDARKFYDLLKRRFV